MSVELLDCTLRDGTYVNSGAFGFQTIKNIISELNASNVEIIECGWLLDCNFSPDKTYFQKISDFEIFAPEIKHAKYSLMLYHDKYNQKEIPKNKGQIDIIREIFHKDKFKEAISHSEIIKDLGYELYYQLVNTVSYSNSELMELAGLSNKINPNCVYIVDTNGSMFGGDLKRIFDILCENLDDKIKIGFHSHNNLQLSFSLGIDFLDFALQKGRDVIIDSSLFGMGRGAGNLNTELIGEYLNKFYFKNYCLDKINLLINDEILKFKDVTDWGYSIPYLMAGSFNIHSRYAKYLTDKYNLDPKSIRDVFFSIEKANRQEFSKELAEKFYRGAL